MRGKLCFISRFLQMSLLGFSGCFRHNTGEHYLSAISNGKPVLDIQNHDFPITIYEKLVENIQLQDSRIWRLFTSIYTKNLIGGSRFGRWSLRIKNVTEPSCTNCSRERLNYALRYNSYKKANFKKPYFIIVVILVFSLTTMIGCQNSSRSFDVQYYRYLVMSRQGTELAQLTCGELVQDMPLSNLDDWQPVIPQLTDIASGEVTRYIKDEKTHTMVVLKDLRSAAQSDDFQDPTGKAAESLESGELYAKWGVSMAEIRREEMARKAFDLHVFKVYPDVDGPRRIEKQILLPQKSELNEVSFKRSIGKYRVTWRTAFHDPYVDLYTALISGAYVPPNANDIKTHGAEWIFRDRFEDTWYNIVSIAAQYQGILFIQSGEAERMLICRRVVPTLDEKNESCCEVVMLAIAVIEESDSLTEVCCAPMTPDGKMQSLVQRSILSFPQEEVGSNFADSLNYLDGLENTGDKLSAYFGSSKEKMNKKDQDDETADIRRKAMCVHRFFQDAGNQIFAPKLFIGKYANKSSANIDKGRYATSGGFLLRVNMPLYFPAEAANQGQMASNYLHLSQVRIIESDMQNVLENITNEMIKEIPGLSSSLPSRLHVHVLSSPDVQAFALPNGDIYVCSGLLNVLDNRGELAAVLAHEICHLASKDAAGRMYSEAEAQEFLRKVKLIVSIAGGFVGPAMNMTSASASGVSSLGSQLIASLSSSMIQQVSPVAAAILVEAALEGYSQEAELRADRFAVTTLSSIGYDPRSMIGVLNTLQDIKGKIHTQSSNPSPPVLSSLMNAKPGLTTRKSEVQKLLSQK